MCPVRTNCVSYITTAFGIMPPCLRCARIVYCTLLRHLVSYHHVSDAHGLCDVHCHCIWCHTAMCPMRTDCVLYITTAFGIKPPCVRCARIVNCTLLRHLVSYRHVSGAHGLCDVHCYCIWYHTAMSPMRTYCLLYIAMAFGIIPPCVRCSRIVYCTLLRHLVSYRHVSGAHVLFIVQCYGNWYHTAMCPMRTDCLLYIATAFGIIPPCVRWARIVYCTLLLHLVSYRHVPDAHGLFIVHYYCIWYHTAMCPVRTDCVMYIAMAFGIIPPCVRCARIV